MHITRVVLDRPAVIKLPALRHEARKRGGKEWDTHFLPATEPSFLPTGSSSSTPAHWPVANSVGPIKRRVPAFMPDEAFTMTRSPTRRPQSVKVVDVCIVTARGDDLVLPVGELTRVVVTCVRPRNRAFSFLGFVMATTAADYRSGEKS